jgi:tetratricopeptide (TPR) repeat protein
MIMITIIYFFFLLLNAEQKEICINEPVVLSTIINADSANAVQSRIYEKEFLLFQKNSGKITPEEYDAEKSKTSTQEESFAVKDSKCWKNRVSIEVYNEAIKTWQPYPETVHLMDFKSDSSSLRIEMNGYYSVDFGIDPETVETMNPGTQHIRARLLVENLIQNRMDTVFSEPETLVVVSERKSLKDPLFLKQLCIYYSRRGLNEKALEYATLYNQTNDNFYEAAILFGNVYEEMGDYDNALKYYLSVKGASEGMPHQYEEYLGTKIQGILSKSPESFNKLITTGKE